MSEEKKKEFQHKTEGLAWFVVFCLISFLLSGLFVFSGLAMGLNSISVPWFGTVFFISRSLLLFISFWIFIRVCDRDRKLVNEIETQFHDFIRKEPNAITIIMVVFILVLMVLAVLLQEYVVIFWIKIRYPGWIESLLG